MRTAIFAPPLREVPVEPDADQARRWLQDELSKAEYQDAQPGFMERAVARILEFLEELLSGIQGVGAPAGILLLALGALVILEPRPGRTAHEAGAALSAVFPAAAEEILWLSRRFDEIRYGGSRAAEADVRRAAELDAGLLRAQPAGAGAAALPSLAVPK